MNYRNRFGNMTFILLMAMMSMNAWAQLNFKNSAGRAVMELTQGGNLGIGTTIPGTSRLSVYGNAAIGTGYYLNAAPSNGMIIQGRLGIGKTSPAYPLDISDNSTTSQTSIHFYAATGDSGGYLASQYGSQFVIAGGCAYKSNTGPDMQARSLRANSIGSYEGNIYFNGNIGLTRGNTFTPRAHMVMGGSGTLYLAGFTPNQVMWPDYQNSGQLRLDVMSLNSGDGRTQIRFRNAKAYSNFFDGGGGYLTSAHFTQFAISAAAQRRDDGNWYVEAPALEAVAAPTAIMSYGGSMYFFTSGNKSKNTIWNMMTDGSNQMTIRYDGNVGIGISNPTALLIVSNNGSTGATCDGNAWYPASSRSVKRNINNLSTEEALNAFHKLEPVSYEYTSRPQGDISLGFIAEDVPDLVSCPGRKNVDPMDFIALLTKVVQEQDKKLKAYEARIQALEKKR